MLVLPLLTLAALGGPPVAVSPGADEDELVCSGPLPFSQAEMEEALRVRRPLLRAAGKIEVRADAGGRTLVRVGGAEREVDWGGRSGEEAARLVAVLALDLARAGDPITVSAGAAPPAARSERTLRLGLTLRSPFDQDGVVSHFAPALDVAVDLARGLAAFVAAGYRRMTAGTGIAVLQMDEFPLRAGLAYRRRWFDLRAGALVRPYSVSGAGKYQGALWGGGISAAACWPILRSWAVMVGAGLDVSGSRAAFSVNQQPTLTTAWLSPWLGAGLVWQVAL